MWKEGINNLALAGEVIIFPIAFSVLVSPAFCDFSLFPFVLFLFCFLLFCRVWLSVFDQNKNGNVNYSVMQSQFCSLI